MSKKNYKNGVIAFICTGIAGMFGFAATRLANGELLIPRKEEKEEPKETSEEVINEIEELTDDEVEVVE